MPVQRLTSLLRTTTRTVPRLNNTSIATTYTHQPNRSTQSASITPSFDQTHENNDPSAPMKESHIASAQPKTESWSGVVKGAEVAPSRSTGIKSEGSGGITAGDAEEGEITMDKGAGPYMKQKGE